MDSHLWATHYPETNIHLKSPSSSASTSSPPTSSSMEFDLGKPVLNTSSLFTIESDHMPCSQYVNRLRQGDTDFMIRQETILLISQLCSNVDPMLSYLAVNYLDRFLSKHALLVEGALIYDAETLQRMEILILGALKWRMRSITPISFLPLFITMFKFDDPPSKLALKPRARQIPERYQAVRFKPSVIATAAVLSAAHNLFPFQFLSFHGAICDCFYVNKEELY